jgi:hypothetical protein
MNEQPPVNAPDEWENVVREKASRFSYPETPDIAAGVCKRLRGRRRVYPVVRIAAVVLLIFLLVTLAVPQTRALVLEFIRVGALRVFPLEPTMTTVPHTPTPQPPSYGRETPLASVLDMPGETTLDDARLQSSFQFGLPTYPTDLGMPDHVYLQDHVAKLVTLVWLSHDNPPQVRLTLEIFDARLLGSKFAHLEDSQGVRVNGRSDALWLPTPSMVAYFFASTGYILERDVRSSVLVWTDGKLTYRLESDLSKNEAIQVAESLR